MFLHPCVILFTGGSVSGGSVSGGSLSGGSLSKGVSVRGSLSRGSRPPLYSDVWVVHILLECILVLMSSFNDGFVLICLPPPINFALDRRDPPISAIIIFRLLIHHFSILK